MYNNKKANLIIAGVSLVLIILLQLLDLEK